MHEQSSSAPVNPGVAGDEVDLVQLSAALFRRWKLILGVFVVVVGLGVAFASTKKPSYRYTASIQLAGYVNTNGNVVYWLKPESAKAMLQQGLIGLAISDYAQANAQFDPSRVKITVQTSRGSDVVTLSGKGAVNQQDAYVAIEKQAAELLAKQTSGHINAYRAGIQASLEQAKVQMAALQDPKRMAVDKSQLHQALLNEQAKLASLRQQHEVLVQKKASLEQSITLYKALAKDLRAYLLKARNDSLTSSRSSDSPTQAMTALLLGNQVQQNQSQLTDIQNQLSVQLPQQISETVAALANNESQQITQQAAVEQAQLNYDNYDVQHQRDVRLKQSDISSLEAKMNQAKPTRLIGPPLRSDQPEGQPRRVIVILSAILGMMVGLFAAIIWNFAAAVRRRIRDEAAQSAPSGMIS